MYEKNISHEKVHVREEHFPRESTCTRRTFSTRKYMYEKNISHEKVHVLEEHFPRESTCTRRTLPTKSKDNVKAMQFLRSEFTIIFIDNIGADP